MASVLKLQALSPAAAPALPARSSLSVFKCGKTSRSSWSVAFCGTNIAR
jgi:hypothetical protein